MEKLSMCRICLVQNVRMCVVTNKSLQEMYEKLADVPFVTEDRKPMLACLFCCTRLKQCCQLQRKCVEAEELLAQMLSEDYERNPLTNRGHSEFVGGFIITPIENISIVDDCLIASDAIKQELPAVCEEQDDVELQPAHHREELNPEDLYNSHVEVEALHSSQSLERQFVMEIKIEGQEEPELSEKLRVRETEKLELENPDKSYPGVEDIPAHDSKANPEDYVTLMEIKTDAEERQGVSKRKRRASVTRRAAVVKEPTLKRKLEDTIPTKRTMNVLSDSKIIWTTKTSTSESVAKIKEPVTTTSQSSFSQSSILIKQTRIHTGEIFFKCDICQRCFDDKSNLEKHVLKHTGEKPFKCNICQRSYKQKSTLNVHLRSHSGKKPYKCDVCQQSFYYKSNLNVHFRKHSGIKPFKCDVCLKSFTHSGNLVVHLRSHSGEKPFKCDICLRSFICKSKLNAHFRIHSGEKPFKCDLCWRSFAQIAYLREHLHIHYGEKPKCDICQRSFMRSSSLKQHIRIHTGDTPHKCDICQRSFIYSTHLKEHIRTHTGEKPFKCDVCQRSFINNRKLNAHIRIHSDEKPVKCD